MRQEGEMWCAYYALPDSMETPIFLGSIRTAAIAKNQKRQEAFMEIMRDIVSDIIEKKTGVRPTWGSPTTAPEHERSGNG